MSKFCEMNGNINHIAEVSTSREDGSPTGEKILTSTNVNTGDVRDTLDGKLVKFESQLVIQDAKFDAEKNNWNAQFNSQFIYKNGGEWADAPAQITDAEKLTYWTIANGDGYAIKGSVPLPIDKPASPVNDDNWFIANAVNVTKMRTDSASQLGLVYLADWASGLVIPDGAMTDKLAVWHDGKFYSIGTDTVFTSNDFAADLDKGWFVSASLTTQMQQWRDDGDVRGWGFDPRSELDQTGVLQKAINDMSFGFSRQVKLPACKCYFTRLFGYYHETLNPGYNKTAPAGFYMAGVGVVPDTGDDTRGTLLISTYTDGDVVMIGGATEDFGGYKTRNTHISDMTIKANTTGFVLRTEPAIYSMLENLEILNANKDGHGIKLTSFWFAHHKKVSVKNTSGSSEPAGDAIQCSTKIQGGLYSISNQSYTNGFKNGVNMVNGQWQSMSIYDSEILGKKYGLLVGSSAGIDTLSLYNPYFESSPSSFIKAVGGGFFTIKQLNIFGGWLLDQGLTGDAFDLEGVNSVILDGLHCQDLETGLLNIRNVPDGCDGTSSVNGLTLRRTKPSSRAYTVFKGVTVPVVKGLSQPGDKNMTLYAANMRPMLLSGGKSGVSSLQTGNVAESNIGIFESTSDWSTYYRVIKNDAVIIASRVAGNQPTIVLNASTKNGDSCIIKNRASSVGNIKVGVQEGVDLAIVEIGKSARFIFAFDTWELV